MSRLIGFALILVGLIFVAVSAQQFFQQKAETKESLKKAEKIVAEVQERQGENNEADDRREQFSPQKNEVIGILHIPKLDKSLPIIEGADEETLKKGVGHYSATKFPGDNEQILLSGHRDTVFRHFGELEAGDRFIVEMPYGKFEYIMREAEIVGADNTTVIGPRGEEVLTLSTCYPFSYIGSAPDRYVIYAYPAE